MSTNSSSAGAGIGQKVKGAFQAVHGIGESIRGNAMDFVDSATGTAQRGHSATERGAQETNVGVANMESHAPTTTTTGAPASALGASTTTAYGAPPTAAAGPPTNTTTSAPASSGLGASTTAATGRTFGTKGDAAYPPGSSTGI